MSGQAQSLGEKIRAARKELKMTQAELAGTDFTKSFISQVEKGFARPSIKSLEIIAARLNKPISFFLDGPESTPPEPPAIKAEHLLHSARSLARDGHFQEALTVYQDILASAPKTEHALRARAFTEMGRVLWSLDRKLEAVNALEEGIELYQHVNDPVARVQALDSLAAYTMELGDLTRAAALLEQGLSILHQHRVNHRALELKLRTDAGLLFARLEQPQRARRHLNAAMELARQLDDYYRWGEICHAMGFLYATEGDLEQAQEYSLRAVRFYESVGNTQRVLQARLNAASLFHRGGNRKAAWEQLTLAEEEARQLPEEEALWAQIYRVKGQLAENEGNHQLAEEAYRESIRHEKDGATLVLLHRRRAQALIHLERLQDAIKVVEAAIPLLEKRRDMSREHLAQAYSELALILKDAGAVEKAQELSLRSLELFR